MHYTMHTIDSPALSTVEDKFGIRFSRAKDSYREWTETPENSDPLHATFDVFNVDQGLELANELHQAGLPADLTERENWSESVELPRYSEHENHRNYRDIYPRFQDGTVYPLSGVTLVYRAENGLTYTQPLEDVSEVGTLIDPDTGEDMEMIGFLRS